MALSEVRTSILLLASVSLCLACSSKSHKSAEEAPPVPSSQGTSSSGPVTTTIDAGLPDMSNHFWAPCRYPLTPETGGDHTTPQSNRELVRGAVRQKLAAIRSCYEKQLLVEPILTGTVTVRAVIEQGRVVRSSVRGMHEVVAECVRTAFAEITFSEEISGPLGYPFHFSPDGSPVPAEESVRWNEDAVDLALRSPGGSEMAVCLEAASAAGLAGSIGLGIEIGESGQLTGVDTFGHGGHTDVARCMKAATSRLVLKLDPNEARRVSCRVTFGHNTVPSDAPVLHLAASGVSWDADTWKWKRSASHITRRSERAAVARGLVDEKATGLAIDDVDPRRAVVVLRIDDDVRAEDIGDVMAAFHYPPMWSFVIEVKEKDKWTRIHEPVVLSDTATVVLLKIEENGTQAWISSILVGASSEEWFSMAKDDHLSSIEALVSGNKDLASQFTHKRIPLKIWSAGSFGDIRGLVVELSSRAGSVVFAAAKPSAWSGQK